MKTTQRTRLTIQDKAAILDKLEGGAKQIDLAKDYKIAPSTVSAILKDADNIRLKLAAAGNVSNKRYTVSKLDEALITWLTAKRQQGHPVSGTELSEKALHFNGRLNGDESFKASRGWIFKFKKRHGLRNVKLCGEKMSADFSAAESFGDEFLEYVEEQGLEFDDIYNADETGLFWRALPECSIVLPGEQKAYGYKSSKERLTAMVCANASGSHKVPMFIIGKAKMPRCFLKKKQEGYANQNKAWMDKKLFIQWYDETFIPSVERYQKDSGKVTNVLLLLDNAPSHPDASALERKGGRFKVYYLPPIVTSLIQPMDQTVIAALKRNYRRHILSSLIEKDDTEPISRQAFLKNYNLLDAIHNLKEAWVEIKTTTLRNAWNKILGDTEADVPALEINESEVQFLDYFQCDLDQPGHMALTEDEIIESVESDSSEYDYEEEVDDEVSVVDITTAGEALAGLQIGLAWYEKLADATFSNKLRLRLLIQKAEMAQRDATMTKTIAQKQSKINHYFSTDK